MTNIEISDNPGESVILTIPDTDIQTVEESLFGEISLFDDKSLFDIVKKNSDIAVKKFIGEAMSIPAFVDFIDKQKVNHKLVADISKNTQKLINQGIFELKQLPNGNFSAILRDKGKFAEQITLKQEFFSPNLLGSLTNVAMQMQLKEVMEKLESIKEQLDRVLQGQQDDRTALCESAIQQMLNANYIQDKTFKQICIGNAIKTVSDGRMQILLSIVRDIKFINNAKCSWFGAEKQEEIDKRMLDLKKNLSTYIKASCVESMLFLSISESNSAIMPLKHCSHSLEKYLDKDARLKLNSNTGGDLIQKDLLEKDYWVNEFPENLGKIQGKIDYIENKYLEYLPNQKMIYGQ